MGTFIKVKAKKYRILGDDTIDETATIQAAINDAIASGAGTVILPPIPSMCKITGPITIQPAPGQSFATLKILAAGGPQNGYSTYFDYTGPSNSSIFVIKDGMLFCQFNGVGVNLGSGQSNVVVWDIQGGGDMGYYLWEHCNNVFNGVTYCIGWRIGQTSAGSNVVNNVWRQCWAEGIDNTSGCIGAQIGGSQAEVQKFDSCGFELLSCGVLNGPISTNLSIPATQGALTIQVFDTFLFPPSGTLQFGDGTQVTYTAKTPTTFTISGGMPNSVGAGMSVNQYVTQQGVYTGISNALTWDGCDNGGNARDFQLVGSATISNSHFESLSPALLVAVAPALTQASGGSLPARTEYYKITFVNPVGETTPSAEVSISANANNLVSVTSPSNPGVNIIGYNVYAAITAGQEKLQNSSPIPLGTSWTEPTTGLTTTGAAPPTFNTTAPNNRFLQIGDWGASAVSGKIEVNGVYIANYTPPMDTNYGFGYSLGVIWMTSNFNLILRNCDIINFISQYTNEVNAPAAPTLTQASGGNLAARTEYYKITFVNPFGETTASTEASISANANNLVSVTSPSNPGANCTGYNVYAATAAGAEKLQNPSPIAFGANWTEPATGLSPSGASPPSTNTATNYFLTIVNAYPFGTVCTENCNISATYPFINNVSNWPLYFRHVVLTATDGQPVSVIDQDYQPPIVLTDAATVNIDLSLGNKFLLSMTGQVNVPAAPALTQASGGNLAARTEYYKITFVNPVGETTPSAEESISANVNNLVTVTSPSNPGGNCTGYNVYAATTSGAEKLQNSSPIAFGTNWTEPTTGLTNTGVSPPSTNTTGANRILTLSNAALGVPRFRLFLQQPASGGPCTVTWSFGSSPPPGGIRWQGGGSGPTLSTTANTIDLVDFDEPLNGTYLGTPRLNY